MDLKIRLVAWKLKANNRRIDAILSDDACEAIFDAKEQLWGMEYSIYQTSLQDILKMAFPK